MQQLSPLFSFETLWPSVIRGEWAAVLLFRSYSKSNLFYLALILKWFDEECNSIFFHNFPSSIRFLNVAEQFFTVQVRSEEPNVRKPGL